MNFWSCITAIGDSATLLPCAMAIFGWLWSSQSMRWVAWRWAAALGCVAMTVAVSKLVFLAWGLGIRGFDFRGFSGHAAMATLVLPSLHGLMASHRSWRARCLAFACGTGMAAMVSVSRVVLHAHSRSEALAGFVLGAMTAAFFVFRVAGRERMEGKAWILAAAIVCLLPVVYDRHFPSERMLRWTAEHLATDVASSMQL